MSGPSGSTLCPDLLQGNWVLQRTLHLRNPYVDPLNLIQAELPRRHRESPDERLADALVVTINSIAASGRQVAGSYQKSGSSHGTSQPGRMPTPLKPAG